MQEGVRGRLSAFVQCDADSACVTVSRRAHPGGGISTENNVGSSVGKPSCRFQSASRNAGGCTCADRHILADLWRIGQVNALHISLVGTKKDLSTFCRIRGIPHHRQAGTPMNKIICWRRGREGVELVKR